MDDQYYLDKLKKLDSDFGNTYSLEYESNNIDSERNAIKNEYTAVSRVLIHRYAPTLVYKINYDNLINEGVSYDNIGSYMNNIYQLANKYIEQPQKVIIKINSLSNYASFNIIINDYESSEELLQAILKNYNLKTKTIHNYVDDRNTMIFINFILDYGKISKFMLDTVAHTIDNIDYYETYIKTFSNLIAALMQLLSFKIIKNNTDQIYITNLNTVGGRLYNYLNVFNNTDDANKFIQELTNRLFVYIRKLNFNVDLLITEVKEQLFKTLVEDESRLLHIKNYPYAE